MTPPRTPVLVGYGQVNQHDEDPGVEPIDLMVAAARCRRGSTGARSRRLGPRRQHAVVALPRPGSAAGAAHARQRRVHPVHRRRRQRAADAGQPGLPGHPGGTRRRLSDCGRRNLAHPNAIARPAEPSRTGRARTSRCRSPTAPTRACRWSGLRRPGSNWIRPAYVYAMFEQALADRRGGVVGRAPRRIGELWSQFSGVAAKNPHAWSRKAAGAAGYLAAERRQPDDQLAVHEADELQQHGRSGRGDHPGLGRRRRPLSRFPRSVGFSRTRAPTRTTPTRSVNAQQLHRSPAIRIAGRRVLELAGVGLDDIDHVDLYSCFPSAVQVAATELGLRRRSSRPLTVTGGLTFAGGPWNNYVTHSIATMARAIGRQPRAARA